jgi:hypothetical protein
MHKDFLKTSELFGSEYPISENDKFLERAISIARCFCGWGPEAPTTLEIKLAADDFRRELIPIRNKCRKIFFQS